jgi:hypothetical protein
MRASQQGRQRYPSRRAGAVMPTMSCSNPQNPDCVNCNKSGLAILPVRYAVVSNNIDAPLPAQMGNKVSSVKLSQHKYALRTLRAGFIYLFHEKHARGSHIKWEVYSVSEAGTVWKQLSPGAMKPVNAEPVCSRSGHNIPASVITIESPEKCQRVWIAFSEHAWSDKTFNAFEQDSKLRDRRMQTFLPATWIAAGDYRHGLPATQENIETVLEYQPAFKAEKINGRAVPAISGPSGVHKPSHLLIQTTRYPAVARNGQSEPLAKLMGEIGKNSKGKDHPPLLMAVWDAVGIVHELNGFRNDTAGWVEKYNAERDQQVSAMMAVEGLKQALSERAANEVDDFQQGVIENSAMYGDLTKRRANAAKLPADRRAGELEVIDILEDWQRRQVPATLFRLRLNEANGATEPLRSQQIAQLQKEVDQFLADRAKNAKRNVGKARAGSWSLYEKQLADSGKSGKKVYQEFKDNYEKFLGAVDKLLNERTIDLVAWLESKYLLDALSEFHPEKEEDGLVFDEQIGKAMIGINSSPAGRHKIDEWVKELKASEHNLIWRSIALNQTKNIREVDDFLALAKQHATEETPAGKIDWITTFSKSLKALADTHKKFASTNTSNIDAASEKGSKAFGIKVNPINTRGSDLLMMTVGDRIFGKFRVFGLADRASERMIQHLFTIRTLIEPIDSLNLIRVQVANEPALRQQTLKNLRDAKRLLADGTPAAKTKQAESLRAGWEEFNKTNAKAPSAVRDARLALLIMLIEGVTFSKLLSDCASKNDAKSWWSLVASGMTIASAMFDLASVPVKALAPGLGDSWSYQRLKLYGGVLSAGAAAVTVVLDAQAAIKKKEQGHTFLYFMYGFKMGFGAVNVAVVAATTFTYAAPLITRLTGSVGLGTAARVIGTRAAAVVATRILFMAVGGWVTVIAFGLQILIWIFEKNDLEIWCSLCIFGIEANAKAAYKSSVQQVAELEKVLVNMGMKPGPETTVAEPKKPVYPTREEMMNHD